MANKNKMIIHGYRFCFQNEHGFASLIFQLAKNLAPSSQSMKFSRERLISLVENKAGFIFIFL